MIEVTGLTKVYGSQVALQAVSLAAPTGSVLTVLGPNGSGKTTLLRLLATLVRPTAGGGQVAGHDLVKDRPAVRRVIGLVSHGTQLYDDLTAFENLAFGHALAGETPARAVLTDALARVGLEAQAGVRARELSSGMRRRLALARVMLRRPRVLLLDEPYAGLDQDSRKRLEEYLHAFKVEGGTVVLVTHSLRRGLAVADRVAILVSGRVAVHETPTAMTPDTLQQLYVTATEVAE